MGPLEYEIRRLANVKRNEDRLNQLGLDGTWKDQMKKREGGGATNKRKKRSIPEPSRKSRGPKRSTTTRGFPMGTRTESEVLDINSHLANNAASKIGKYDPLLS